MATASIRSRVTAPVAKPDITDASRDDLAAGDVVELESVNTGTAYQWSIAFKPEGSTAVFSSSGSETAIVKDPGTFSVDVDGPYLIRLAFTDGTGTTEQFVRLRALTAVGGLKLVAAGERYDTIRVPVDATASGWADEQNFNLTRLLSLIGGGGGSSTSTIKQVITFASVSPVVVTALSVGDVVVDVYVKVTTDFDGAAPEITVGTTATPDLYMAAGDSDLTATNTYQATPMDEVVGVATNLEVTVSGMAGATQGSALLVALIHRV